MKHFEKGFELEDPHRRFMRLTLDRYKAMVKRFAERKDKRDRVYRYARQIPFTLEDFRAWVLELLGGNEDGVCRCYLCNTFLNIITLVVEHKTPPDRGGSLGFENLGPACAACNHRKGGMTAEAYLFLVKCLDRLPIADRDDVMHRLQIAVQLAAKDRNERAKKFKQAQQNQQEELPANV